MNTRATVIGLLIYFTSCSLGDVEKHEAGLNQTSQIKAGKNFLLGSDEVNFFQAYFNCKDAGMDLASITSKQDDEDLAYFLNKEDRTGGFWISGTNLADTSSSQYSWLTGGKRAIYTNWFPNQPSNDGGEENCIQWAESSGNIGWNDYSCQRTIRYICQDPE